ncbi:MAG: EAL domain-containing protein, partial [Ruminiclostridium sp.]|nr:EAL domain-containing protein [Ruminiclostridium sp.]
PFAIVILLIVTKPFTGAIFTISKEQGYQRGAALYSVYAISYMYMLAGCLYVIACHNVLKKTKFVSLVFVYLMVCTSVIIQLFVSDLMIEIITTVLGFVVIILFVLQPEELSDSSVGSLSFEAYKLELEKVLITKQHVQIVMISFRNSNEIRSYLGEERYLINMSKIISTLDSIFFRERLAFGIYFEHPGTIFIIVDEPGYNVEKLFVRFEENVNNFFEEISAFGESLVPVACKVDIPEDLNDFNEIMNFGREYASLMKPDVHYVNASEIIALRDYRVIINMDSILNRAVSQELFCMYYQPIYSFEKGRFVSAEALIRLNDKEHGFIPPSLFIPAAEKRGIIQSIGDFVLEDVFRFISKTDFEALGLEYIEINLSVAQCMEDDLPAKFAVLSEQFRVPPEKVNLEITETTYEDIGNVMEFNLETLSGMGYTFSLDDYGTGYSNMQRVSRLPLDLIKLDKSLVDDLETRVGGSILRNTIRMILMQSAGRLLMHLRQSEKSLV